MLVDTNVLVRHLTGDPPAQAQRATRLLVEADDLLLPDLIVAECWYVLRSVYGLPGERVATALSAVVRSRSVRVVYPELLALALRHAAEGFGFADGYLLALAELADAGPIVSFDRAFDAVPGVERVEP